MPFHHITNNNANTNVASSAAPAPVYSMDDLNEVTKCCVNTYIMCCLRDDLQIELNQQTQRLIFPEDELTEDYLDSFVSRLDAYAAIVDENSAEIHRDEWNCFKTQATSPEYLTPRTREMIRQLRPTMKQTILEELDVTANGVDNLMNTTEKSWFYYCYAVLTRTLDEMTMANIRYLIEEYRVQVITESGISGTRLDWMHIRYSDPE